MTIVFFCCHYGMFTMIQGIFVFVIFGTAALKTHTAGSGALAPGFWWWLAFAFLGLCVSHGVSFWRNYLGAGEYRSLSPQAIMTQPYGRVVVMQLTVILGGILIDAMGTPLAGLILLVCLNMGLDVITHRREHRKVLSRVAPTRQAL